MSYASNNVSEMKMARIRAGLSQDRLAALVKSYQVRISRVERGKSTPTANEGEMIAFVLGVAPEELFPNRGDER
jgi:transcriptional regulator with XRE-family HTH domain